VRGAPVAGGALALLDDDVDGLVRRREVGDRDEPVPLHELGAGLRRRRADEEALRAERARKPREPDVDRAVEVADGGVALWRGHDVVVGHERTRALDRDLRLGVVEGEALGPLEEEEVPERLLAEGDERDLHARGKCFAAVGRFGRLRCGAAPIAVSRFCTSVRCSISCFATVRMPSRQRSTAPSCVAVRPSSMRCFIVNAAKRYSHRMVCSSSAASRSR
jgi:hypothetical protein